MIHYLQLFLSALGLVACKSFQQENVVNRKWKLVPPTSYIFAFFELLLLDGGIGVLGGEGSIVVASAAMGTGAWIGAFTSMYIHDRLELRNGQNQAKNLG